MGGDGHGITYEGILSLYQHEQANGVERDAIVVAVEKVLDRMDSDMRHYRALNEGSANMAGYYSFVKRLGAGAVIFTLNHDLWFERFMAGGIVDKLNILGQQTPGKSVDITQPWQTSSYFWSPEVHRPTSVLCYVDEAALNIVKLHGGLNWEGTDGRILVMGANKESDIQADEVLSKLQELFSVHITSAPKVLVYGYGFRDTHVNEVLLKAAKLGSVFYVFDALPFPDWLENIRSFWTQPHEFSDVFVPRVKHYSSLGERVFGYANNQRLDARLVDFFR
jgi:hypothetical protein